MTQLLRALLVGLCVLPTVALSQSSKDDLHTLLRLAVKCPLEPVLVASEDDGRFSTNDLITQRYIGEAGNLRLAGSVETRVYNGDLLKTGVGTREFSYTAQYSRIDAVIVSGNSATITCKSKKACIEYVANVRDCTQRQLSQNGCPGPMRSERKAMASFSIGLCSAQKADDVRFAVSGLRDYYPDPNTTLVDDITFTMQPPSTTASPTNPK